MFIVFLGKVTKHSIALHSNSTGAIPIIIPVTTHIHKPGNTSVFQEVLEGALNGKKESIQQHIINVVNISLPDIGGWVCWEKIQVFLKDKEMMQTMFNNMDVLIITTEISNTWRKIHSCEELLLYAYQIHSLWWEQPLTAGSIREYVSSCLGGGLHQAPPQQASCADGCPVCFIDVLTVEKAASKQKVGHVKEGVLRVEGIMIQGL